LLQTELGTTPQQNFHTVPTYKVTRHHFSPRISPCLINPTVFTLIPHWNIMVDIQQTTPLYFNHQRLANIFKARDYQWSLLTELEPIWWKLSERRSITGASDRTNPIRNAISTWNVKAAESHRGYKGWTHTEISDADMCAVQEDHAVCWKVFKGKTKTFRLHPALQTFWEQTPEQHGEFRSLHLLHRTP